MILDDFFTFSASGEGSSRGEGGAASHPASQPATASHNLATYINALPPHLLSLLQPTSHDFIRTTTHKAIRLSAKPPNSNKVGGLGGGSFPPPVLPRSLRASAMGRPAFLVLSRSNVQVDLFLRDDWDGKNPMSPD